jgi:photosystem II stability/assembly factor-like uncharacterized protein
MKAPRLFGKLAPVMSALETAVVCSVVGGGFGGRGGLIRDLLSTSDGGLTWISRPVPPSAVALDGVSCPSAMECMAVGFDYSSSAPTAQPAAVIVTSDGGATWAPVP